MKRSHFRILAPFTHIEDIKLLKNAGADELYCGYVNEELTKRWPLAFNVLNRRGENSSFENYVIFKKAVEQAEKNSLPVYVTVNGLYTPEQYPFLLELISTIERLRGVRGIIVADLGLLLTIKKNNFKKEIHMSTGGNVFNSQTVDFYSNLGANRVILDRQLTANEIEDTVSKMKSKIDIEIFIIAEGCGGFIDGFCTFFHCLEKAHRTKVGKGVFLLPQYNIEQESRGCNFHKGLLSAGRFKAFSSATYQEYNRSLRYQPHIVQRIGCRICDLYKLYHYPIKGLKIIGRGLPRARQVELISKVRSWLEHRDMSERGYKEKCKSLVSRTFLKNGLRCSKFDCYFDTYWVKRDSKGN